MKYERLDIPANDAQFLETRQFQVRRLTMRNFHVKLADGSERNIKADDFSVDHNGILSFQNGEERVVIYNANQWTMVEVERLDDRG
jgi:hypothetical protein